jgi:hypothetical protein
MPDETDSPLTAKQAAQYLELSEAQFNRRVKQGEIKPLPSVRLRGRKFSKVELDRYRTEWINRNEQ